MFNQTFYERYTADETNVHIQGYSDTQAHSNTQ